MLNEYAYGEGKAKKGGNNVCSLLYKNLVEEGIIKQWKDSGKIPGKRLSLGCDNCAGQNKNNMVLHMGLWLINMGIFEEVEIIFLKAGHTKISVIDASRT
jgi:hypothetical protein